ncbi:MAG: tRNA guanosine(34) transglycosylase Tgt [Planctomycetota bacterium]
MPGPLTFDIQHRSASTRARAGVITTPNGSFPTPAFMPVGTRATVKGVYPHQLRAMGAGCLLANTYHLMLRPGESLIERRGGLHPFMNWDGPILTDSGGYQAYSMADINAVDEDGVSFRSIITEEKIRLTPERAVRVQNALGADIIMAFDDCPPSVDPKAGPVNQTRIRLAAIRDAAGDDYDHGARLDLALDRTTRWLGRCVEAHARPDDQALFGIVQGGTDPERRRRSAEAVTAIDCPGYAIGGVAVGEQSDDIERVTALTAPLLPETKPRYLMGVGYPRDIVAAVLAGVDMFDCVLPTRNGRNANAFMQRETGPDGRYQIRLKNARFAEDDAPLEPGCDCPACDPVACGWAGVRGPFTRAAIRHLFISGEMLGPMLVSLHNLRLFQRLTEDLRAAIATDAWEPFIRAWPGVEDVVRRAIGTGSGTAPRESEGP